MGESAAAASFGGFDEPDDGFVGAGPVLGFTEPADDLAGVFRGGDLGAEQVGGLEFVAEFLFQVIDREAQGFIILESGHVPGTESDDGGCDEQHHDGTVQPGPDTQIHLHGRHGSTSGCRCEVFWGDDLLWFGGGGRMSALAA